MKKYTEKKQRNQVFQNFIKRHIGENQMDLVENCNTFLSFVTNRRMDKKKLYKSNPCKNRFCPMCAWRKARKDALGLSLMMQHIKQAEDKQFIFLTLTTPNVRFCCKVKIICTSIQNYKSKYCFNSKEFC
ncbi:TPA: protein rep [Staphylococcus aureus]|nr:protein rep [Staphylococcus aureus]HEE1503829.1 protein rep [Staphylococcus aureus]